MMGSCTNPFRKRRTVMGSPRCWTAWLPLVGVGLFVAAYFYAASLYPGGTQFDLYTVGYHHLANYWCDLLSGISYSGAVNPGRPVAIAATVILPLSLIPLWVEIPRLFGRGSRLRRLSQVTGCISMLATALVFTPLHDAVIHVGSVTALCALLAIEAGLARAGRTELCWLGVVAAGAGVANYVMWSGGLLTWAMPGVQKAAGLALFVWVVLLVRAVVREHTRCRLGTSEAETTIIPEERECDTYSVPDRRGCP